MDSSLKNDESAVMNICNLVTVPYLKSALKDLHSQSTRPAVIDNNKFVFFRELFCDFGESFVINDVDGEEPITNMVASITKVGLCFFTWWL